MPTRSTASCGRRPPARTAGSPCTTPMPIAMAATIISLRCHCWRTRSNEIRIQITPADGPITTGDERGNSGAAAMPRGISSLEETPGNTPCPSSTSILTCSRWTISNLLRANGTGKYTLKKTKAGQDAVHLYDAPFMTLFPGMWDYELRIKKMDEAKVDVAIVSLTCPNAYWGGREVALKAAQIVNDSMAEQQRAKPDRIRWFASLPFQYADDAKAELARCVKNGAVGVMVIANIDGEDLTNPKFAPVWARDRQARAAGAGASRRAAGRARTAHGRVQHDPADRLHVRHHARLRADDLFRLSRQVSEHQADRLAWRRDAAVSRRAGSTAAGR